MQHSEKLLIVDDDKSILDILELSLNCLGYENVSRAQCAAEALFIIEESDHQFDCFLIDIQMPEYDGVELCRMIRQLPEYSATPIIMVTAMMDRAYVDRAFVAGATDYMTKPFEAADLKSRLELAWRLKSELADRDIVLGEAGAEEVQIADFGDVFEIDDLPGFLAPSSFENYASQMCRSRVVNMEYSVMSVENAHDIFHKLGPRDFQHYITDVSDAVSENIPDGGFFTYVGSGAFYLALPRDDQSDQMPDLEVLVERTITNMDVFYNDGVQPETRLTGAIAIPSGGAEQKTMSVAPIQIEQPSVIEHKQTQERSLSNVLSNVLGSFF